MNRKPNIVIFNPDEMRWDALAHMGLNPAAVTPFLDEFAATDAVSFDSAFCQNPVCVPSRCSMFTGLYPHVHGHRTMAYLMRPGEETLFSELKAQGYYVWMNSRNDLISGNYDGLFESHADEIFWGGNVPAAPGRKDNKAVPGNKYFKTQFGGELATDEKGINYGSDDEDVDALIERFRSKKDERPIFGFLGLAYPHCPYQVEEPYFSAIDRSLIPHRINENECHGKSDIMKRIREVMNLKDMEEADWTELRVVYAGMCMKIDALFGRFVNALKEMGEYDNTLIIFVSDHGDFAGDYGLPEKAQNTFEDCLVRVPFLIKPPEWEKSDPGVTSSLIELVDLYATVHDYAGTSPSHTHFGRSVRPTVEDRSAVIREFVTAEGGRLAEETHCNEYLQSAGQGKPTSKFSPYWSRHFAQTDDDAHAKGLMIRTDVDKYVCRVNGKDEYYDLVADPAEKNNLFGDEAYSARITELQVKGLRWMQATSDVVPFDTDSRSTARLVWEKVKLMVPPEHEEEVKEMCRKGMNRFMIQEYCRKQFTEKP